MGGTGKVRVEGRAVCLREDGSQAAWERRTGAATSKEGEKGFLAPSQRNQEKNPVVKGAKIMRP